VTFFDFAALGAPVVVDLRGARGLRGVAAFRGAAGVVLGPLTA